MLVRMKVKYSDTIIKIQKEYERIFLLSDVHNDFLHYLQMRNALQWGEKDLVVIVGDIVDRGGEHADPIHLFQETRYPENRNYDVILLQGNHEKRLAQMLHTYLITGLRNTQSRSVYNTFDMMLSELPKTVLKDYMEWLLDSLPKWIEMDIAGSGYKRKFLISHDLRTAINAIKKENREETGEETLSELFTKAKNDKINKMHTIVAGHIPTFRARYYAGEYAPEETIINTDILRIGDRLWCIDCGNAYREGLGGKLGCIELSGKGNVKEYYF